MTTGSGVATAEQLLRLPRGSGRHELVRGELRRMTPSGHLHGKVAAAVLVRLGAFVREHRLGVTYAAETGFILERAPDTVRAPDASFVTAERVAAADLSREGYFPGAPDLAIEVLSPSDTKNAIDEKVAMWLERGARVVIVLDPRRKTASVHRPSAGASTLTADDDLAIAELLPGWTVPLRDLFA